MGARKGEDAVIKCAECGNAPTETAVAGADATFTESLVCHWCAAEVCSASCANAHDVRAHGLPPLLAEPKDVKTVERIAIKCQCGNELVTSVGGEVECERCRTRYRSDSPVDPTPPLRMFQLDDAEWVIALSEADARAIWCESTGEKPEDYPDQEWDEVPAEQTLAMMVDADGKICCSDDKFASLKLTAAEWIAREGRCYLGGIYE